MKNIVLFLFFLTAYPLLAQDESVKLKLRHIKGIRGVDVEYGISKFGNYYGVGYVHFFNDVFFINPSLKYETSRIGLTDVWQYSLFLSFQRSIYKVEDVLFINAGFAPCAQVQTSKNEVLEKEDLSFPFGAALNFNIELYVLNRLALRADFSEIYSYNDKFGSFRYLAGGGLRFYFN